MDSDLSRLDLLGVEYFGINISDFGTAALILIMVTMGLTLKVQDFTRIALIPRPVLFGLVAQIVLLPMVAIGLVFAFQPPFPIAMGLIILSCCPGAATSNFFSYLAKGDVALSITLTALSGLIVVFSLPVIVNANLEWFGHDSLAISLPVVPAMMRIFTLIVVPVAIGMAARRLWPNIAMRLEPIATKLSFSAVLLALVGLFIHAWPIMPTLIGSAWKVTLALNVAMMAIGFAGACLLRVNEAQSRTISIEVGVQNYILSIVIAIGMLKRPDFGAVPILYLFVMYITVFTFIVWCRVFRAQSSQNAATSAIL